MNLNKKLVLSFSLMIFLTSCYSGNNITSTQINNNIQIKNNGGEIVADLGNNNGNHFSFKLNFSGFNTKDNKSGSVVANTSAMQSIKVWLVELPTGSTPISVNSSITPVSGAVFSYDNSNANPIVTFTNVPTNNSGMSYYVAASAFSVLSGGVTGPNQNSGNNITNKTSSTNRVLIDGITPAALSQGGGDTAPSNRAGSIIVGSSPTYTVSTTNSLSLNLKLQDDVGALLETNIAPVSGSSTIGSVAASNITGNIETIAGTGSLGYSGDGGASTNAQLKNPIGIAMDSSNNIYITDSNNCVIRKIDAATRVITTVAGTGTCGSSGDGGIATNAQLNNPQGLAVDTTGYQIYVADSGNSAIRKFSVGGNMTTVAGQLGNPGSFGEGTFATLATLNTPMSVAFDLSNNMYIADTFNNKIRRINTGGTINTVAGTGTNGYSGDNGPATNALLNSPISITVDSSSNIYIADLNNNAIRKFTVGGSIYTIAGGFLGSVGDGSYATLSKLNNPRAVAVDNSGSIFINDSGNSVIRKINPYGIIDLYAGIYSSSGYNGDNIKATSAQLNLSSSTSLGMFVDNKGNLYISDYNNHRVRKVL